MPSDIRPNNFVRPAGEMGTSSELKKNSKQENSCKIVKQRAISPQPSRSPKYQKDKLKVKNSVRSSYSDMHRERKQDRDDKNLVQAKSSGNHQRQFDKANTNKEDELVKHMSNLPGYLQRPETGENIQEKALNFGVLDWAQLEKWKYKQKQIPARGSDNVVRSSSDFSTTIHSKTFSERHSLPRSNLNSSQKVGHPQGAKLPVKNVMRFQDFETASKSNVDGQKKVPWTYKSFGRNCSDKMLDKEKRKDSDHKITSEMAKFSTNSRTNGISPSQKHNVIDEWGESEIKRKDRDQKIISESRASHRRGISLSSKEKLGSGSGENRKRVEELRQPDIDLTNGRSHGEKKNIVLPRPKELPKNEFPEVLQLSQPKQSKEKPSEAQWSAFSDTFSGEVVHSAGLSSEIPYSCPLPSSVEANVMSGMVPHTLINARCNELSSVVSRTSQCSNKSSSMLSKSRYAERNDLDLELTNSDVDTVKISDEETTVLGARNGRYLSPHRFSFSLGRLRRSFSFKEVSSAPQLSSSYVSIKSGPVRSETSVSFDNSNREKSILHNRAKSSPLRRLLDPILQKVANRHHSAETLQPLKESLDSFSPRPTSVSHSLQNEKHEASTTQALLQLTVKNGLPLLKFMVENDRKVLAATMKNLTSSGKDDSGQNYTFYYVNEFKKKTGGWMSHGSKRDNCSFVYNVIGQMKISCSCFSDLSGHYSSNQYMVRESVLFGVELRQADQETLKFKPKRELAAVVVKIPCEKLSHDGMDSNRVEELCIKRLPEDRCSCNFKENEESDSIMVILPGGVHSSPNKGEPSPLLDRWRSGGSCDCGGWDVGCKLRVLSNQNRGSKIDETSKACPTPEHIELFVQVQLYTKLFQIISFKIQPPLSQNVHSC
jgi:hypothetical protein